DIIEEYKSFSYDSALVYVDRNLHVARKKINRECEIRTLFQYAFILSSSGLFREAEIVMNQIPREELTPELMIEYFKSYLTFYSNLTAYLNDERFSQEYYPLINNLIDSVYYYLPESTPDKIYYLALIEERSGNTEYAIELTEKYVRNLHPDAHEYAKVNFYLAGLYHQLGNTDRWITHVIRAAIADTKDAITENLALLTLASWLYEQKDIERAYGYIQAALLDANFYNARFRNLQISRTLPIINEAYQKYQQQQSRQMKWALIFTSTFFFLLLVAVLYLIKQTRILREMRQELRESNEHLEEVNEQLNTVNLELSEANRVKEEYIGHFMDLYSGYIAKMDDYRKMINNKIAAKRFEELQKMTSSGRGKDSDVKELYDNFDKAFLKIYPGFVDAVNGLLKEDERFELRKGELLNTELRVFALIRLGITDSARIADFLRCSLQTVYNYRSKIKKKALSEETDIEEQIRHIGSYIVKN
ncbi:MAG: DUF6377 domain-containing protein, partial [Tannerellaceae bacterium]|nr:DUF6377 domain-containing protein [Tannerellaceae bacterium]